MRLLIRCLILLTVNTVKQCIILILYKKAGNWMLINLPRVSPTFYEQLYCAILFWAHFSAYRGQFHQNFRCAISPKSFTKKLQSHNVREKLCKALSYEKCMHKNDGEIAPCMQFGFVMFNIWQKNIAAKAAPQKLLRKSCSAKAARKMLIKLPRDHFRQHYLGSISFKLYLQLLHAKIPKA